MIARQFDPIAELQSAFTVLTKNISLAAIPTVALVLCGGIFVLVLLATGASAFASGLFGSNGTDMTALMGALAGGAIFFGIALVVAVIIMLIAQAAVIAGSQAAWEGRTPDLSAGIQRAIARAGDLLIAGLVLSLIFIVISWTFVGPLALCFLMLYVAPAIVVGNEGAMAALGTSWRMSTQNFGPTFAAFAGIVVAAIAGGIVNAILGHIPLVGWIAGLMVSGFVSAYQALVIVRFYELVRGTASMQPVAVSPGTPPPPPPTPVN